MWQEKVKFKDNFYLENHNKRQKNLGELNYDNERKKKNFKIMTHKKKIKLKELEKPKSDFKEPYPISKIFK